MTTFLRPLSNALEGDFPSLSNLLCCRLFRKVLRRVNAVATHLGVAPLPIGEEVLLPDVAGVTSFKPELGAVMQGLLRAWVGPDDWQWLSGQMMIAAFMAQVVPSLAIEVRGRHPLLIAGHVVTGDHLIIRADQEAIEVRGSQGVRLLRLGRVELDGVAPVYARDPQSDLVRLGSGGVALLSKGAWLAQWQPETAAESPLAADQQLSRRTFEASTALLERQAPRQYLWTTLILHEILALPPPFALTATSQSFFNWPGEVHISQTSVAHTTALLIHECSHLYFYLAKWTNPLVKKDAPEEYSSIKKRKRPLERVLLGYHALGSVLLTLPLLRNCGLDERELDRLLDEHREIVAGLGEAVDKHERELEPGGRDLYYPLKERLGVVEAPRNAMDPSRLAAMVHDA